MSLVLAPTAVTTMLRISDVVLSHDQHTAIYLARLVSGGRRTMHQALDIITTILVPESGAFTLS